MRDLDAHGIVAQLRDRIRGRVEADRPLAMLTTYRLGGPAAVYVEPADRTDIQGIGEVLSDLHDSGVHVPILTIGRGSNLVVSDRGWPGIAIRLAGEGWSWIGELGDDDGGPGLSAGAATSLPLLSNWAARRGLSGAEFLIAVPGSVGGAVRMNAGAHGQELADCLLSALVFDLTSMSLHERSVTSMEYSYRHSALSERHVVLEAKLRLVHKKPDAVRSRVEEFRRHRAATQPGALQNAGSVFKNPPGDHAGRLVEAAGLKGLTVGGARVSELHANFFIAGAGATAADVHALVHEVRQRVLAEFGVELTPEIKFVGDFGALADHGVAR